MPRRFATAAAAALLASACSDTTAPPTPATVEAFAGQGQTGVAGAAVAVVPAVRVLDDAGRPMSGVTVRFEVEAGGGEVSGAAPKTRADGTASPVAWVLGVTAGINALVAEVDGLPVVRFEADGVAGAAALMAAETGASQSAAVGQRLADPLAVRVTDAHGNPVADVSVDFAVVDGAGTIESSTAVTGADGIASGGEWRLGDVAGTQRVRASAAGIAQPVVFTATAAPGPPATLQAYAGANQVGRVGLPLEVAPAVRVRDAFGNIVPGATVRFWVEPGGGVVGMPTAAAEWQTLSDQLGVASAGSWVLGTASGPQTLVAELTGGSTLAFTAIAQPGAPAAVRVYAGDSQTAAAGAFVAISPTVLVEDDYGNPVPGAAVMFTPSEGGSAQPSSASTALSGRASTSWRLGPQTGTQQLEARTGTLPAIAFTATATVAGGDEEDPGGFHIDIRFTTPVASSQSAIFEQAAAGWAGAVVGDLPAAQLIAEAGACGTGHPAINESIDDLVVYVTIEPIDGVGNVLGSAGPCFVRSAGGLPLLGVMRLDEADVANMEVNGRLADVIAHEIGHILGIGTLWSGFINGGSTDPHFTGAAAVASFDDVGGATYAGNPVPVEDTGGSGTRFGHWRETVFASELMTGWIGGGSNPLSVVTVAALQDLGYTVDLGAADAFTIVGAAPPSALVTPLIELREVPLPITPMPVPTRR